jgi:hypothetical protein
MTALARGRLNMALGLAIPTAGFLYLSSSGVPPANAPMAGLIIGVGVLWLAAVVRINTLPLVRVSRVVQGTRDFSTDHPPLPPRTIRPAYVVDASRPIKPWRWTSVLLAPLELLAVAWTLPVMILLIMVPVGLGLVGALWLARLIFNLF